MLVQVVGGHAEGGAFFLKLAVEDDRFLPVPGRGYIGIHDTAMPSLSVHALYLQLTRKVLLKSPYQ